MRFHMSPLENHSNYVSYIMTDTHITEVYLEKKQTKDMS